MVTPGHAGFRFYSGSVWQYSKMPKKVWGSENHVDTFFYSWLRIGSLLALNGYDDDDFDNDFGDHCDDFDNDFEDDDDDFDNDFDDDFDDDDDDFDNDFDNDFGDYGTILITSLVTMVRFWFWFWWLWWRFW